jgi:hypothetical protein
MKKLAVLMVASLLIGLVSAGLALAQGEKTESFAGKVTAIDPDGKAIVIESGSGKKALAVGAIVTPNTALMVKGKKKEIGDLNKEVKAGDMVSLKISRTTDLYAKEISKK